MDNHQLCHCGKPLHYQNRMVQRMIEELIHLKGENMEVRVNDKTYIVPRHYIALHGLKGWEIPELGFEEKSQ